MTYLEYLDDLLLAVADAQNGAKIEIVNLRKIHAERFGDCPDTWLLTAATEFHHMGYGIDWQDTANETFRISGGGLKRAAEIRAEREGRKLTVRSKNFLAANWIAVFALLVSVIALFKE